MVDWVPAYAGMTVVGWMDLGSQGICHSMTAAPETTTPIDTALIARLRRLVQVDPAEIPGLIWSALYFFCVLAAYFIVRPIRDDIGVRLGPDSLSILFTVVFVVMIAAVPIFGWLATRFKRAAVVPVVYSFFIANLLLFWALFQADTGSAMLAGCFYVWVSVFNLFAVSLFWSLMSDKWSSDQAKRLYGCIAAGGSAGAVTGPLIVRNLVKTIGNVNLMLIAAALLVAALGCIAVLRRVERKGGTEQDRPTPRLNDVIAGATSVWNSPYLFKIALTVLLANVISTYFYFELNRIVGATISDSASRTQLFADADFYANSLCILAQVFLTAAVVQRLGVGLTAAMLPIAVVVGLLTMVVAPTLTVIVSVVVLERAAAFSFSNPAFRVLYTSVPADDKYKAQSFIDTVVYRGGDATSGWLKGIAGAYGMSMATLALLAVPLAMWWLWLAVKLGREHDARAKTQAEAK